VRAFADEHGNVVIASTLRGSCPHIRTRRPDIPDSVANAIMKAISLERNDRQPDVKSLADELFAEYPERLAEVRGPPRVRALDLEVALPHDPLPTISPRSTGSGSSPTLAPGTIAGQTVGNTMAPVGSEFLDANQRPSKRGAWALFVGGLVAVIAFGAFLLSRPEPASPKPARPTMPARTEPAEPLPPAVVETPPAEPLAAEPAVAEPAVAEPTGTPEPAVAKPSKPTTEPAVADATSDPVVEEEAPPEAAPAAVTTPEPAVVATPPEPAPSPPEAAPAPSPEGTWNGRANNRTFALTLAVQGNALSGSARFANPGGGDRTLAVKGTFEPKSGKLSFAAGEEFDFQGMVMDSSHLSGNYKPRGSNKSFAWNVER
jgi:hypothetical protein